MLARIFNAVFFVVFFILFLEIIFRRYGEGFYTCDYRLHLIIIAVAAVLTALALFVFRFCSKKDPTAKRLMPHAAKSDQKERSVLPVIFIAVGIILLLQILAAYLLWTEPIGDSKELYNYASDFAVTGNFDKIQLDYQNEYTYMIRYPHNFMGMFINAYVYRIWYLITGRLSRLPMLALNVLAINAAVLFTALLARKTYGDKKALYVLGFSALFVPFYTYTAYCYTDSMSLPFGVGAILILAYALSCEKTSSRLLLFAAAGCTAFFGYKIKGSIIILFAAVLIYLLLKLRFKRFLSAALAFVVGFGCLWVSYNTAFNASGIVTEEQVYEQEYPATHWVMMGLSNHGGFNYDDWQVTYGILGKNEKKEKNIEVIKERLEEMGADGLLQHLTTKAIWTWGDGTYYVSTHLDDPIHRNILHEYVLYGGKYYDRLFAYCGGFQLLLLLLMALSAFKGVLRPSCDLTLLYRIVVFGVFLFLLVWETRSRYLFSFTPFFLLLTADGAECGLSLCSAFRSAACPQKQLESGVG